MNNVTIKQLRHYYRTALASLDLMEAAQDAVEMKIADDWHGRIVNDINELLIPEPQKKQYMDLSVADVWDQAIKATVTVQRIHLTIHEETTVPCS